MAQVVDFQRVCTVCAAPVVWLTWEEGCSRFGREWLESQRVLVFRTVGEDVVSLDVWSCRRHAKHYGITVAAFDQSTGPDSPWSSRV